MPDITITCERCGLEFTVDKSRWRTRYCKECKQDADRENRLRASKKSKAKMQKKKSIEMPLEKILILQDKYNREHGTFYTYGQFTAKLESGEIKIEE